MPSPALIPLGSPLPLLLGVPVITPADLEPLPLGSWRQPQRPTLARLVQRFRTAGFVLVHGPTPPDEHDLTALAARLRLGPPFTPPVYRDRPGHASASGVSRLTAAGSPGAHPVFHAATAQPPHCDGTLQRLGHIRTTVLLCHTPAAEGGESLLFNATAALGELAAADPAAAAALMHPQILARTSTLPGSAGTSTIGPAFAVTGGRLLTRYSRTATDYYQPDVVADPAALTRALDHLADAAEPGSPHAHRVCLAAGQGLLIANDALAHGRTAWRDDPTRPRLMLRALFTRRPRL